MQLISILMIAVAVLVFFAGLSVLFGLRKKNWQKGLRFFLATLGSVLWTVSIFVLLNLPTDAIETANFVAVLIIASITMCDVGLLAYLSWEYKNGKLATLMFSLVGITLVAILAINPSVFFEGISLNENCNKIIIEKGWYFYALIVYFFAISITFSGYLNQRIKATTNKGLKTGLKIFYVGLSIGGILALVFDLLLLTTLPEYIWIGPMASSISILSFYYSVVKYRMISISSRIMKVMSYTILGSTGIILYTLVFYAVFTALFHIPNPSTAVILLNFIMAVILICLMPAINEIIGILKGAINYDKIQFHYIVKKLENINPAEADYKDIAKFLADNMHYSYVGLIVNDRSYFSTNIRISIDEVASIEKMKSQNGQIFVIPDRAVSKMFQRYDISRVGVLYDREKKEIGKIVFGKKLNKVEISDMDFVEYEAIINIISVIVSNGSRKS